MKISLNRLSHNLLAYAIIITSLLTGSVMYRVLTNSHITRGSCLFLMCAFIAVDLFLDGAINMRSISFVCLSGVYLLAHIVITRFSVESNILYILIPFLMLALYAFNLVYWDRAEDVFRCFSNFMVAISLISLFFWVFGSLMNVLPGRTSMMYDWGYKARTTYTYGQLYFENPLQATYFFGTRVVRNTGIFVEAPGFANRLLYALAFEMFCNKNKSSRWKSIILTITMLTTFSSKGYAIVLMIYAMRYVLMTESKSKRVFLIKFICGTVIVAAGAVLAFEIVISRAGSGSGEARFDHMQAGFTAWLHNPLFGVGLNNSAMLTQHFQSNSTPEGLSMGLTTLMGYGGIWLLLLYGGAMVFAQRYALRHQNGRKMFIFLAALFVDLFISNVATSMVSLFLVALGYAVALQPPKDFGDLELEEANG